MAGLPHPRRQALPATCEVTCVPRLPRLTSGHGMGRPPSDARSAALLCTCALRPARIPQRGGKRGSVPAGRRLLLSGVGWVSLEGTSVRHQSGAACLVPQVPHPAVNPSVLIYPFILPNTTHLPTPIHPPTQQIVLELLPGPVAMLGTRALCLRGTDH